MGSHDTGAAAPLTPEQVAYAEAHGLTVVNVVCQSASGAKSRAFLAMVRAVPRAGERIVHTDGAVFEVRKVYHKVVPREEGGYLMMPNVYAVLREKPDGGRPSGSFLIPQPGAGPAPPK